jgi:hypothetical protein
MEARYVRGLALARRATAEFTALPRLFWPAKRENTSTNETTAPNGTDTSPTLPKQYEKRCVAQSFS